MLGYGIGYIGQGASYNFMSAYFVLFLTNCVGMESALAGTISSVALLIEVIAGMIVGNWSDNCTSRLGRRRPFLLASAIGMPIVLIMITHTVHLTNTAVFIYYLVMGIFFRIFFSTFEIPNGAMGAEIASGYDERTRLRTFSRIFSIIGNGIGYVSPLIILDLFANQETGWQATGIFVSCTCFISWMLGFILSRGKTIRITEKTSKHNIMREIAGNYIELARLKPMKLLIVYKAAFGCAYALYSVATIYFLKYNLGMSNKAASYMYIFTIVIFAVFTPVTNVMAIKMGKANQQKIMLLLTGIVGLAAYFISPDSTAVGILYVGVFSAMQTGFWQLSTSIFYDVVEVDEYVNGKRREGDIMSLVSVLGTLITALIVQIFGIMLSFCGFDPDLVCQPESTAAFLNAAFILIPAVCCIIGFWALNVFPINKKTFNSLVKALDNRRKGLDYSMYEEDINKIIGKKQVR